MSRDIRLDAGETAAIIRALPDGVAVEIGFGPSGAWLKDNPENAPAIQLLQEIRAPLPSGEGLFVGEGE